MNKIELQLVNRDYITFDKDAEVKQWVKIVKNIDVLIEVKDEKIISARLYVGNVRKKEQLKEIKKAFKVLAKDVKSIDPKCPSSFLLK